MTQRGCGWRIWVFLAIVAIVDQAGAWAAAVVTRPIRQFGYGWLNCAAISPDGRQILTGGGGGAFLWDAESGREIRSFLMNSDVVATAFSADGSRILAGQNGTVKLWDVASGAELGTFPGVSTIPTGDYQNFIAISADGRKVLTLPGDNVPRLWDAATGAELHAFTATTPNQVEALALSPDGSKVAISYITTVGLWDAATGTELRVLPGHPGSNGYFFCIRALAFSPDGTKVLTGADDKTAKLWDVATGAVLSTFSGHNGAVNSVAISPDGRQVLTGDSYDDGKTVRLWDAATGKLIRTFDGHHFWIHSVGFSADGRKVLTSAWDGTAKLWDATTGGEIRSFNEHLWQARAAAFSPDGSKVLIGGNDLTTSQTPHTVAKLYELATGTLIQTLSGHGEDVTSVAFSPDGAKVLTGTNDKTAKLWDVATGAEIRAFAGHTQTINAVAFSPDGTRVLTGSGDTTAKLWDAATGSELRTFTGHTSCVNDVAFSPDGRQALTGGGVQTQAGREYTTVDATARLWDTATGAAIRTFADYLAPVWTVAFSPDGTQVLTGSGAAETRASGTVYQYTVIIGSSALLRDAASGAQIRNFNVSSPGLVDNGSIVCSAAISPDGTKVLTAEGKANLWNGATGDLIRSFAHTNMIRKAVFSPDGKKVLTVSTTDATVRLWDINGNPGSNSANPAAWSLLE